MAEQWTYIFLKNKSEVLTKTGLYRIIMCNLGFSSYGFDRIDA